MTPEINDALVLLVYAMIAAVIIWATHPASTTVLLLIVFGLFITGLLVVFLPLAFVVQVIGIVGITIWHYTDKAYRWYKRRKLR